MPKRSSKKRKDVNILASEIIGTATADFAAGDGKNPHAVALGRMGGLKGGRARASKLTPEQRSEIAKLAASVRWRKKS